MKKLSGAEVRESYLSWFEKRGHTRYASDSLVPSNDPTLLFTGAGMNQFKDMFLGKGNLPFNRATTSQKCLRVPDLENVGLTAGHHTFFEMLGNFSFGDYFKEDCIPWVFGWFHEALGIPVERLVVTIFEDDDEAWRIWRDQVGLPEERIFRFGEKENFWPASAPSKGPNGPCGPCSEIYFDWNPGETLPGKEGLESLPEPRFVEIGNCVFTQFDRRDGGVLEPLPQKNIDVGLGLERITAVINGKRSNFETDLFVPYIDFVAALVREKAGRKGFAYGQDARDDIRLRRIADHIRAVSFCIADGVLPSNEGRGYVLRKVLRRACRDGYELGLTDPFLHGLASVVVEVMGGAYPELPRSLPQIKSLVQQEEKSFRGIYSQGAEKLQAWISGLATEDRQGWARREVDERGELPVPPESGRIAFELHDTFGFPVDISRAMLLDEGLALDEASFADSMEAQRKRAREGSEIVGELFVEGFVHKIKEKGIPATRFTGYETCRGEGIVLALGIGADWIESLTQGRAELVTDQTPFYAESGGQVGDRGQVTGPEGRARVLECSKQDGYHFHLIEMVEGSLAVGEAVTLEVDLESRLATERNHTATHLLHQALKDVLGPQVAQAGSLVAPDRLRFDYTQGERPTAEQLEEVERIVNREILSAIAVKAVEMPLKEAQKAGFTGLFGEKYGETVRTLSVGAYSRELCGGTHVANSGQIGQFRIVSDASLAAGIRRIEAVTGLAALDLGRQDAASLDHLARELKSPREEIGERVAALRGQLKQAQKALEQKRLADAGEALGDLMEGVREQGEARILAARVAGAGNKELLDLTDRLRKKHKSFAGILFGESEGQVALVAVATKDLVDRGIRAGDLVKACAGILGGGGGGRPEMAQGKGRDASKIPDAMDMAWEMLEALGARS